MPGLIAETALVICASLGGAGLGYFGHALRDRRLADAAADPVMAPAERNALAVLAAISHEIRTPLNGVLAIADVLNRTGLSPKQQQLVAVMLSSGQAVNAALNHMLELADPDAATTPSAAEPAPTPPGAEAGPAESNRALIVDDNAINRQVIEMILDSAGIAHLSVENGLEAVEAATKERFPVVLMDLQMPVMDGFEATRRIREMERRRGGLRASIIVVSANCLDEHIAAGRAAGADNHMAKPISAAALIAAISEPRGNERAAA